MRNPFKVMASLIKKFKRKRRLSSELHDRWGDTDISYPNDGSWNQWNQQAGFIANAAIQYPQDLNTNQHKRYPSAGSDPQRSPGSHKFPGSPNSDPTNASPPPFPQGYYNQNIRRSDNSGPNFRGLGISTPSAHSSRESKDPMDAEDSCDELDDEERDTLGDPGEGRIHRNYMTGDLRSSGRDDSAYSDRASKSPALSVTSRMRRSSTQSSATQCSSVAGGSRRGSYTTAASSVSAPSLPPDTPRFAYSGMHSAHAEKRPAPRPKLREPDLVSPQQMVPSYDDLYG